jgi:predicted ATPase/DNA-binding SARP family transcriptional activator/Tfp pilus assembly protein PilF
VDQERPSGDGLSVRLLGGFAVGLGSSLLGAGDFPRRKAQQLVKLLALQPGARLQRDQVIEALWPHLAPDAAAHQLHNALSQARSTLRTLVGRSFDPLAVEAGVVSLRHPTGVDSDFHRALGDARGALVDGSTGALARALAPLAHPLLPDDLYEAWSEAPREEARAMAVRLRLALAEALLAERRPHDIANVIEPLLRDEPSSEPAYRLLMRAAADDGDAASLERAYRRCRDALQRELGAEPSRETLRLLAALRERSAVAPDGPVPDEAALPLPATPFVGRSFELAEVERHLAAPGSRLVTLTGIGGIGKTRLALEAARRRAAATGVHAVAIEVPEGLSEDHLLSLLVDAAAVPVAAPEEREAALVASLARRRLLLVLDSAEHALAARPLLARLLAAAPGLVVLAASRQRLELQGERVVDVAGLEVPRPEAGVDLARFGAVRLFTDSAERSSGVVLGAADAEAIGRICRLLHGVPLALELAASWVGVLSCDEISAELGRGLDLLVSTSVDTPERHRSLRHAFEQTWRLLDDEERRSLARLSVFPAPCALDAARRVVELPLPALRSLAGKSLLTQPSPGRCAIHPVVRQFAAEKLSREETALLAEAHARHYLQRLDEASAQLESGAERRVIHGIVADVPHFRAAFLHAVEAGDVDGLDAGLDGLTKLFDKLGWHQEGQSLLETALRAWAPGGAVGADAPRAAVRFVARLEARAASFLHALGRAEEARRGLERSCELLARLREDTEHALALDKLALVMHDLGDDVAAVELLQVALGVRRRSGDRDAVATSLNNLGSMAFALGALDDAEGWCREALELQQALGATKGAAISLQNLASIRAARGDMPAAETLLAEGLALARAIDSGSLTALFLGNLARLTLQRGDLGVATVRAREAVASALEVGATALAAGVVPTLAAIAERRGDHPEAVALCMLALGAPSAGRETRVHAESLLLRVARLLDPATMAAAQQRGASLRLDDLLLASSPAARADAAPT